MTTYNFTVTYPNGQTFTFSQTFADFDEQIRFFDFAKNAETHGWKFTFIKTGTNSDGEVN